MRKKYVFRLSAEVKGDLDAMVPPRQHGRSDFVNDALSKFLDEGKKTLADRPHLRGRLDAYKQVCALIDTAQLERAKNLYAEVSISVVIQAAVSLALAVRQDTIRELPIGNICAVDALDDKQDPNDYPRPARAARRLATAID